MRGRVAVEPWGTANVLCTRPFHGQDNRVVVVDLIPISILHPRPSHLERHSRLHLDINDLNALSSRDQASQAAVPKGKYGSPRPVSVPQNVVDVSVDVIGSAAVPSVLDCLVKKSLAEISFDTSPHQQGNGKTGTKYSVAQSKGEAAKNKKSNRVFKCDFCDKCFSQSGNLSRHRVIHMKLRPFKCDECGKVMYTFV